MEVTARHAGPGWSPVRSVAVVTATVAVLLGLAAAPASAAPNNPCATARAIFKANMDEARYWLGQSDKLAGAGNEASANAAAAEADHFMGVAEGALNDMAAC